MNAAAASQETTPREDEDLIEEIIRMSDFSFERLPMLDIIGSRMAVFLPAALSELTRSVCEAEFINIDYVPLSQAIESFPNPVLIAVASSPVLDGRYLVAMDAPLVLSCLETSLGGKPNADRGKVGENGFTAIERGFASQLAQLALSELRQSFSVIGDIAPELESIENDIEAAVVAQQASLCIKMEFELQISTEVCRLQLVFPYDTVEPIRLHLSKVYYGERGDEVSPWRDTITRSIESATIELEIVLTEREMFMREIMAMSPGHVLELPIGEDQESIAVCYGTALFKCVNGKRNNGLAAIRILDDIQF